MARPTKASAPAAKAAPRKKRLRRPHMPIAVNAATLLIDRSFEYCGAAATDEDRRAREVAVMGIVRCVLSPLIVPEVDAAAVTAEPAPSDAPAQAEPARERIEERRPVDRPWVPAATRDALAAYRSREAHEAALVAEASRPRNGVPRV